MTSLFLKTLARQKFKVSKNICNNEVHQLEGTTSPTGGTYNGLQVEAPPERCTFSGYAGK